MVPGHQGGDLWLRTIPKQDVAVQHLGAGTFEDGRGNGRPWQRGNRGLQRRKTPWKAFVMPSRCLMGLNLMFASRLTTNSSSTTTARCRFHPPICRESPNGSRNGTMMNWWSWVSSVLRLFSTTRPFSACGEMKGEWVALRSNGPIRKPKRVEDFLEENTTTSTLQTPCSLQNRPWMHVKFPKKTPCSTPFTEACRPPLGYPRHSGLGRP